MKPFTVLGYSANDEVFCPACLRSTTGLGPSDTDYNGRPILPLYAADTTVQEECCTYCGSSLLDLRLVAEAERGKAEPAFHVEKTRHQGRQPALRFDRKPPEEIRTELKRAGWRWDPVASRRPTLVVAEGCAGSGAGLAEPPSGAGEGRRAAAHHPPRRTAGAGVGEAAMAKDLLRERLLMDGPRALSDVELLTMLGAGGAASRPVPELAWLTVAELRRLGVGEARAVALAAAFELGRRGAWAPPKRGERCLDPGRVYELMRPLAHAPVEEFHVVLLDVRGRLIRAERVAQGSVSQCPVSPRDTLRVAVREGAHGLVFVHNHPSGSPEPSPDDGDLTERLRAASELVGIVARDHVIVASGGYYSFVEAGRWRR